MFMRKRTKADDSFYEKRVQSLSKSKVIRISNEDSNHKSQNALRRLMTIRKQKAQNQLYREQDYSPQMQNYNSRTEANATVTIKERGEDISFYDDQQYTANDLQTSINTEGAGLCYSINKGNFMSKRQNRTSNKKNSSNGICDIRFDTSVNGTANS